MLSATEIDFLTSLNDSELTSILETLDKPTQRQVLTELIRSNRSKTDQRGTDVERKRVQRSEAARIVIPDCVNPGRREQCLGDPERFLRTYFKDRYTRDFGKDHAAMIHAIYDRAKHGGKKAVAAPRHRGKTEVCRGMMVFLVLAGLIRFPVAVCSTTALASKTYMDFRAKFMASEMLYEDFPEICHPVKELDGAPARANKQHVDGKLTRIVWKAADYLSFPHCPLPSNLGGGPSPYGGVKMAYYGLDAAVRGINIDGDRPDFLLIDDPETEESARSIHQIQVRENRIEKDLVNLGQEDGPDLPMVAITTVQNRYCLSFRLTDPSIKQAWDGERFGRFVKWPNVVESHDELGLWGDYIAQRHKDQTSGDRHGLNAVRLYLDNREAMDAGAEMISDEFHAGILDDGTQTVYSAIQAAFNRIADTSMDAFLEEEQNDPPETEEITTIGLSAARVQSRESGYTQHEIPAETECITVGLDLGKYASHWVKIAWRNPAIGCIVDYGVMETHGLAIDSNSKAVERALLSSIEVFSDEISEESAPILCLIDSGTYTAAAYEACRRLGRPFYPSKGWDARRFRLPNRTDTQVPFIDAYARSQPDQRVWLYNVNTEAWKLRLQEWFLTQTFDESGDFSPGTLSLFAAGDNPKRHLSFAHHIVAEEQRMVPVFGKQLKAEWFVVSRNNHWLDATALACAAGGCVGIRLVEPQPEEQPPAEQPREPQESPFAVNGRPFLVTQR